MNSSYTPFHHPPSRSAHRAVSSHPRTHFHRFTTINPTFLPRVIHIVLASLIAIFCGATLVAQNYAPTDITVPAGDLFRADAMNDHGEVVGAYLNAGGQEQPAVWRNGVFTQLPLLPGTVNGWVRGINNVGQMVGVCRTEGTYAYQACVWENGTVRALPSPTGTTESAAWAINDAGTIVGHVYTPRTYNGPFREAVVWQGNTVAKLVPPTAGARTWARAIDNFGRVAVSWTTEEEWSWEWHAARWTPTVPNGTTGAMTTLGIFGAAYDINDSGVVSGNEGGFAYLWAPTSTTALQTPYWGNVKALGLNNSGVAVGSNEDPDFYITTPLVWDDGLVGRDLNLLLTATTSYAYPGSLVEGRAVNTSGQILVYTYTGTENYVVLTPSSDPVAPAQPPPPAWIDVYPGDGVLNLYWPAPYFATSYNVKRSTVSGGPYTTIATEVPWNGYSDTSVVNGTQYYYVVSSVNGSYESVNSPEFTGTPNRILPEAPTDVSISAGVGLVNLQWSPGYFATSYNVKRATVSGGPYTTIAAGISDTTYTDASVVNGTRYYYVVSSVNGSDESADSAVANALPLAPPTAPINLTASVAKGGKAAKLSWMQSASPGIQSNVIYRSVNGGTYVQLAQISAGTAYTDSTTRNNVTYSYVVTAVNVNGTSSPFSNAATVRSR